MASKQFHQLHDLLLQMAAQDVDASRIDYDSLIHSSFACEALRPAGPETAFQDETFSVQRWTPTGKTSAEKHAGAAGIQRALRELIHPFRGASDVHVKFKLIHVELAGDDVTTRQYFHISGRTATGMMQQSATWSAAWYWPERKELPKLTAITVERFEEVAVKHADGPLFADCTESVLGSNRSYREQLSAGIDHWASRIESVHGIELLARYGVAVGDVNGDGLDDLYVCQPGGLPNRLYGQNADGTATDRSNEAGVDWLDQSASALLIDLDNDGDQDLVVAMNRCLLVSSNDGTGHFQVAAIVDVYDTGPQALSAIDYDHDGDLDLYLCVEYATVRANEERAAFRYHDANDGGANLLLRNDGKDGRGRWRFTDVTSEVGLDANNRRHSLAASWEDYDNDGDMDLYVANDYGQNCLYRNDGGRFIDVATEADVIDFGSGMSVSWADFDRDGWMDLYVANMFSSAGNRITNQANFRPEDDQPTRQRYRRFAKGNTLFRNLRDGTFSELGAEANVEMGRWAWSSPFLDINNDGWEDILVANGFLTTEDTGDL
ncbi:MAG: FG-GAP repeat domain-containing protein [Pirellulales bacterium]